MLWNRHQSRQPTGCSLPTSALLEKYPTECPLAIRNPGFTLTGSIWARIRVGFHLHMGGSWSPQTNEISPEMCTEWGARVTWDGVFESQYSTGNLRSQWKPKLRPQPRAPFILSSPLLISISLSPPSFPVPHPNFPPQGTTFKVRGREQGRRQRTLEIWKDVLHTPFCPVHSYKKCLCNFTLFKY